MKIINIEISNYRNLDSVSLSLAEHCNFIVGENNLGKSNLLCLLNTIFTNRSFNNEDFKNLNKPIKIKVKLKLEQIEIGHFQDLFDINDDSTIEIICIQNNVDDYIEYFHYETNTYIRPQTIKCINYVHYDSLRNPITEINFDKGKGVGRFLRSIVSQYLIDNDLLNNNFIDQTVLSDLVKSINDKISKIKSFKDFNISALPDDNTEALLAKVITLKDAKGDNLSKAGYGVQFLILVTLSILERIQQIKIQRKDKGIFQDEETNTKAISLVIGLDEPEIHLHPYMQRSLVKYLSAIITNSNPEFSQLVKELFDIDHFIGQIIVITHSPNIVLNNYKEIIRFYSESGKTKVISGVNLSFSEQIEKHLFIHFPFIKEAFFARCIIAVEGASEYASFPLFAQKLGAELDDLGISIIQAGGDSIHQLIELSNNFGIPSVGISDKDNGTKSVVFSNHYQTNLRDFEEEIISIIDNGREEILRKILCEYDGLGEERVLDARALNKKAHKMYNVGGPYSVDLKLADINLSDITNLKAYYLTWYGINKSLPLGYLIGLNYLEGDIPAIYKDVIYTAQHLTKNV